MVRRLLLVVVGFSLLTTVTTSTWAGNIKVVSYNQLLSGATNTFSFPPANSCGGEPRTIVLKSDGSFRITMVTNGPNAGFYWITPDQNGTFRIPPNQPGDPEFTGRFELQPDTHTGSAREITFFLHLVGRGSDGTDLDTRLLERLEIGRDRVSISMASPAFLAAQLRCA